MSIERPRTRAAREFGDFQTPAELARAATQVLCSLGVHPRSILEPTCGRGEFVAAASVSFPEAESVIGIDINRDHLNLAGTRVIPRDRRIELRQGDFFKLDWRDIVRRAGAPWLIVGNPPWVTNADLGAIESDNLPEKSNFHGRAGIEAITGKSNFDISEWMLLRYLDWLEGSEGTIAVLCKTAVARKILLHVWKKNIPMRFAQIYMIDALGHFGAAVDACFFVLKTEPKAEAVTCAVFDALDAQIPSHTIGFLHGHLISDAAAISNYSGLFGQDNRYIWRSGIKHDCSKVMELAITQGRHQNGLGETVSIEDTILFPMLKSSDIGNGRARCRGAMIVTQRFVGEDTNYISEIAPRTWEYLTRHAALLNKRASAIYRNKPPFSIFGVGPYSFAPWKVAISGFYKKLHFVKVGPLNGRPIVFDDTIYFLPCGSEEEASFVEALLRSEVAETFLRAMIHWDEKRPITAEILRRLNLQKLAAMLRRDKDYSRFAGPQTQPLSASSGTHTFDPL
jgi:methylase of polypeptide subunit release factors